MLNSKLLGGTAAGKTYIEDVFSTWLYTGNSSTQTITNGIDLSGKGGLVWCKARATGSTSNVLYDTARGATKMLFSNSTDSQITASNTLTSFNGDGFTFGADTTYAYSNSSGVGTYASWTFRKAAKFFDVVTYTGNGSTQTINHNLGSVPGCIIIKGTNSTFNWRVYHRSLANNQALNLNTTDGVASSVSDWNSTTPTATSFSLGSTSYLNANGSTYVAYIFAHDTGTDGLIQCGSYTGNGSTTGPTVSLGWEPQWVLIKNATTTFNWWIADNMRGTPVGGTTALLQPNTGNAENLTANYINPTSTGFQIVSDNANFNTSGNTYIYIAIRRGPMRTPTDATKVFAVSSPATGTYTTTTNFPIDSAIVRSESTVADWQMMARLTGNTKYLNTNATAAESTSAGAFNIDSNTSFTQNLVVTNPLNYIFRRAPGFFDAVAYTGTGSATTISHNLGVAPELMIVKRRNSTGVWAVYAGSQGATKYLLLDQTNASATASSVWNDTSPTISVFSVGTDPALNASGGTYIAYLFATCPGVSKVGTFSGSNTSNVQVDCGFTNGARFVLVKCYNISGTDWFVWDSARGITTSTDPYLRLNSTAAEVTNTNYIAPYSAGFQMNSGGIMAPGYEFIYLAIA